MPLLSFSGTTKVGTFYQLILNRTKTQTCRLPRKRPIKKGDRLFMYWKVRVPKHKKPIHFICEKKCSTITTLRYKDFAFNNVFARRDGFVDCNELQEWFGEPYTYGEEIYDVIEFK